MGFPYEIPLKGGLSIAAPTLRQSLGESILSASGWRKVFAVDPDNPDMINEESGSSSITPADKLFAALMADVFADFILRRNPPDQNGPAPLIIGTDSRPTGAVLADIMMRVFLQRAIPLRYLFISAAPELMSYTARCGEAAGFCYISASHNPIGHNGVKWGLQNGGVISSDEAAELKQAFLASLTDQERIDRVSDSLQKSMAPLLLDVLKEQPRYKEEARRAYRLFSREVIADTDQDTASRLFDQLREEAAKTPFGILGELNGSARGASIDEEFFAEAGFRTIMLNRKPGEIVHRIVPEGASLDLCRQALAEAAGEDPAFTLGYVPDNDGDRGNLVFREASSGRVRILEAQEVFALTVMAELAYIRSRRPGKTGLDADEPTAVVVNGPTSLRIEAIAAAFGAQVFRAEVGEANVVNLARAKRREGYRIRILGEGSNGGNITHPGAVRDPLNTLFSIAKLLLLRGHDGDPGLFQLWCRAAGKEAYYRPDFTLEDILATLPRFTTTSAYEPEAKMAIKASRHGALKSSYEDFFKRDWEQRRDYLEKQYGICRWEELNYEGMEAKRGCGSHYRSGFETGGLKIIFKTEAGGERGFIWMRGSGTEPVFRIAADAAEPDSSGLHHYLLEWQRDLVSRADTAACTNSPA